MIAVKGVIGVVGAGTMGAGIAQLATLAGYETVMHDPFIDALERGGESVKHGLERAAERGHHSVEMCRAATARLALASELNQLESCALVIEAAPERLDLKREIVARLSRILASDAVIASNTSSIPISSLVSAAADPSSVLGMHFFNPPAVMQLLEIVTTPVTGARALSVARTVGEAMGKEVIVAHDGPGFLVNRCGRPFYTEALRMLQERVAEHHQIDRICRLGGGFRMGPFELMDLVGIDVGLEVAKSFDHQSFGEPRWRPSPLQARMVALGRFGRKSGQGWYAYPGGAHRANDLAPMQPGNGEGRLVVVDGSESLARALRQRAREVGFDVCESVELGSQVPDLIVDASLPFASSGLRPPEGGPPSRLMREPKPRSARAAWGMRVPPTATARALLDRRADSTRHDARRGDRGDRGILRGTWLPGRMGRGRAGARARAHRLPAHQRSGLCARRGNRIACGHRSRPRARSKPPTRATCVVRFDRPRSGPRDDRRALRGAARGALSSSAEVAPGRSSRRCTCVTGSRLEGSGWR